jgi:hypothetical protein
MRKPANTAGKKNHKTGNQSDRNFTVPTPNMRRHNRRFAGGGIPCAGKYAALRKFNLSILRNAV